ncbi:hypothetical protein KJ678_01445, partial [Patescibacteria group bacterium]|nr:hypothetical protein [Patescibacteria group bacterium]
MLIKCLWKETVIEVNFINYLFMGIILGGFGDQVEFIVRIWWERFYLSGVEHNSYHNILFGAPFGQIYQNLLNTNQPIFWSLLRFGMKVFGSVDFLFISSALALLISFVATFAFFKKLGIQIVLAGALSLIFSVSPFYCIHVGRHIDLIQFWVIPVSGLTLVKIIEFKGNKFWHISFSIGLGSLIFLATLLSNYLGFFILLFYFVFLISTFLVRKLFGDLSLFTLKRILGSIVVSMIIFLSLLILTLFPYIKSNYYQKLFSKNNLLQSGDVFTVQRSLEDFQNFSGRPWYLVLPPIQNPVFGGVTKSVLNWMKSDWGYFLADDYFNNESPEMFLGWGNILVFIFSIAYFVKRSKCQMTNDKIKTALIFG